LQLDAADLQLIWWIAVAVTAFFVAVLLSLGLGVIYLYHLRNDIRTIRSLMAVFIQVKSLPNATEDKLSALAQKASTDPPWWK